MTLTGQVALVTGATSGIGKATAEALAGAGARLVVTGRREDALKSLAEGLPGCAVLAGDMTDPALPRAAVERALAAHGRLDLCVNNAGSIALGSIEEIDIEAV
jgi:NADP-dependent 3-hydroxy acid dehydrogenase YdfG